MTRPSPEDAFPVPAPRLEAFELVTLPIGVSLTAARFEQFARTLVRAPSTMAARAMSPAGRYIVDLVLPGVPCEYEARARVSSTDEGPDWSRL